MQSSEFDNLFKRYPCIYKHFKGVCSIDTIPKLKLHEFVIFNEDFSYGKGTHWLTLCNSKKTVLECFDSLGLDLKKQELLRHYLKVDKPIVYVKFNETEFQPKDSSNCGLYAAYFAINRLLNLDLSLNKFFEFYFSLDAEVNEGKVLNFFE